LNYDTTPDGTFYYVMELLDGFDLDALVAKHGPQPPERVVHILRQACDSLGEAHATGLVHRDVKPADMNVCRYGRAVDFVKVLDFGMVKDALSEPGLTQMGTFAGTPHYAAPEMAQGLLDQIDSRSDIYALGCVAFFLLTGRTPFVAETAMKLLMCHVNDAPEPASAFVEGVPPELVRVVLDCLEKDPSRRPASTDVLDERLAAVPLAESWSQDRASDWWTRNVDTSGN